MDMSVASSTSAMYDINTQLWGMCIIRKEEEKQLQTNYTNHYK